MSYMGKPLLAAVLTRLPELGSRLRCKFFPGYLYNYGSPLPPVIDETAPMHPSSRKGQLRAAMEERMAEAAERGVRVIILRAGDFFGGGGHGSWLDLVITKDIRRNRLTYPG